MRALKVSFAVLLATALAQAALVVVTDSVALLGDTLHNLADALTALPLAVAFLLGRRAATKRFTYGLGRAEDLAGLVVVGLIAASAVAAGYQAVARVLDPRPVEHLPLLALAGVVGFLGNEWVARYRIRIGREIGSAALVADGLHARTDGFTSLAVVGAALGAWLGIPYADPVIGMGMAVLIAMVLREAAREVFARLLDGVDPAMVERAEVALATAPGVRGVDSVRLRWVGHRQFAEAVIVTDDDATLVAAHAIAVTAEHRLRDALPRLDGVTLHVDPLSCAGPHR
ncbi:cation efflux system protein [Actinokineospora fastidiosa]|uniref:Cation efflux system protein n=2 Tax=Actinokineospora fastidiosa TaxID=1816 RepID=A0A918G3H6_9PSEU|nr:cation efflux system protein [Actinokineospora fastidiosa]